MKDGTRSEVRQLPLMLGKVASGILAAAGFGGLVYISTRPPKPTALAVVSWAVAGVVGLVAFALCSRAMALRSAKEAPDAGSGKYPGAKALPWVILLALAAAAIVVILLIS